MKLKLVVIFNLLLCCFVKSDDDERTLSVELNPGCVNQKTETECEHISFVHIAAESPNNTLHYIWDFTGIPAFFLAKTNKNTSLNIDWNSFLKGDASSVNFSSTPDFIFSAVIHKVLLFDDSEDKANVNDDLVTEVTSFNPYLFNWKRENLTQAADEATISISATVNGSAENFTSNGTISMKVNWKKKK